MSVNESLQFLGTITFPHLVTKKKFISGVEYKYWYHRY